MKEVGLLLALFDPLDDGQPLVSFQGEPFALQP